MQETLEGGQREQDHTPGPGVFRTPEHVIPIEVRVHVQQPSKIHEVLQRQPQVFGPVPTEKEAQRFGIEKWNRSPANRYLDGGIKRAVDFDRLNPAARLSCPVDFEQMTGAAIHQLVVAGVPESTFKELRTCMPFGCIP